ncbi:MAG TPA: hypothetical protein VMX13_16720 [Sedimentisphaerales bacterium]|nr:hypothetical protein [Sedimentisphaerales bacterium]
MKVEWVVSAVLGALLFFSLSGASAAVNTRRIREVRSKDVLSAEDLRSIDNFVADAVKELIRTKEFSSVAAVRNAISEHADSTGPSAPQYEAEFFESAYKHISEALQKARDEGSFIAEVNLLILVERLLATGPKDLRLVDLALGPIADGNAVVRYLAVSAVTSPAIVKQLDPKLAERIVRQLEAAVDAGNPETMGLMARFTADVRSAEGDKLLLEVADARIKSYGEWTVEFEPLDDAILKSLCSRIASESGHKLELVQRFCQLYSYVIQRYLQDMQGGNFLDDRSREQTASVLVEVEKACIGVLTGSPRSGIKGAIERGDAAGLSRAHDSLLAEELPRIFPELKAPLPLPQRPKSKVPE